MNHVVSIPNYVTKLKEQGLFALGEPLVRYKIEKLEEKASFFLSHEKHGIHGELSSVRFAQDSRKVNPVLAMTTSSSPMYEILTIEEFLRTYKKRFISDELFNVSQVKNKAVRTYEPKKHLGQILSYDILDRDLAVKEVKNVSVKNLNVLYQTTKFEEKDLEKIIYLSRVEGLNLDDKAALMDCPLTWIATGFNPAESYSKITMPNTISPITTKTIQRSVIYTNNPI